MFGSSDCGEHPWHRLERGEIDFATYCEEFAALCERHAVSLPCPSLHEIYDLHPNRRLIHELLSWRSPALKIGIATNNVAEMRAWWHCQVDAGQFDVVFDSSLIHCRKPDAKFFLAIGEYCDHSDIALHHTWLVDDVRANVEGALRVGMRGLVVDGEEDAILAAVERLRYP